MAAIPPQIARFDFSAIIGRLTRHFTGRGWLFDSLEELLSSEESHLVLLTGKPGIGKSAVAAELLRRSKDVAAFHFCIARRAATITPGTVIRSICSQLCHNLPGFGEALLKSIRPYQLAVNIHIDAPNAENVTGVVVESISTKGPDEDLEVLLRVPLAEMSNPHRRAVIVVDGLDEALSYKTSPTIVELIAKLNDLPSWVRLFCTSRSSDAVFSHLEPLHPVFLESRSRENRRDLRKYIRSRVRQPSIKRKLRAAGIDAKAFVKSFAAKASGNFLFATTVLDDIAAGRLAADRSDEFPSSISAVYRQFLRRFSDKHWEFLYKPLLGKLAVAQEPLSETQLARFSGLRPSKVRSALGKIDQYLEAVEVDGEGVTYELFHESLREFLLSSKRAGRYWCHAEEEHDAIVNCYLPDHEKCAWADRDSYGLRHLPVHLQRSFRSDQLRKLLGDFRWLSAKLAAGTVSDVLSDYRLLLGDPRLESIAATIRLSAFAIERDRDQLWQQLLNRSMTRSDPLLDHMPVRPRGPLLRLLTPTLRQCGDPLSWVFTGHRDLVKDVCAVPASSTLLSASVDKTVRLWDLSAGREVRRFCGHTDTVTSVSTTHDGQEFVSGSRDRTVRIWEVGTGRQLHVLDNFFGEVEQVAVSPDGRYFAVNVHTINQSEILVFNWVGRRLIHQIVEPRSKYRFAWIPGTPHLAVRTKNAVDIFDVESGGAIRRLSHDDGGDSMVFVQTGLATSSDGKWLASGGLGKNPLRVFSLLSDTSISLPTDRQGAITKLAFSPSGRLLACAGKPWQILPDNNVLDDIVRVWDVQKRECIAKYPHDGILQAVTISADERYVISATGNGKVSVWDLERGSGHVPPTGGEVTEVRVRQASGCAFVSSLAGTVTRWDLSTFTVKEHLRSTLPLFALDVNRHGDVVLASGHEYSIIENCSVFSDHVLRWRLSPRTTKDELFSSIKGLNHDRYTHISFCPTGQHALLIRNDYEYLGKCFLEIWSLTKGAMIKSIATGSDGRERVNTAMWMRDGKRLLTISTELKLWRPLGFWVGPWTIARHDYHMQCMSLSTEEDLVAVGNVHGEVEIWKISPAQLLAQFKVHDGPVKSVGFFGGDERIVTTSNDRFVKVWLWRQRRLLAAFCGDSEMNAMECGEDGSTIVAGEESGRVHFLHFEVN
jgi:WD40 repeat protein